LNPNYVNWRQHFPHYFGGSLEETTLIHNNTPEYPITYESPVDPLFNGSLKNIDFLDIGCGFGGLLFSLSMKFP
jgi:tRNA G46 methylase TrmB